MHMHMHMHMHMRMCMHNMCMYMFYHVHTREQTRLVSRSQPLADKWQTNKSTSSSTASGLFLAALHGTARAST